MHNFNILLSVSDYDTQFSLIVFKDALFKCKQDTQDIKKTLHAI